MNAYPLPNLTPDDAPGALEGLSPARQAALLAAARRRFDAELLGRRPATARNALDLEPAPGVRPDWPPLSPKRRELARAQEMPR